MNLNNARLATFKAAILAETTPALVNSRTAGSTGGIAAWYNGNSSVIVWKTSVSRDLTLGTIPIAALRALTAVELAILQTYLLAENTQCGDAQIRNAFFNLFPSNSATPAVVTANTQLNTLFKRAATRAEAVFATGGSGTDADPHRLVVEGDVLNNDVVDALRS